MQRRSLFAALTAGALAPFAPGSSAQAAWPSQPVEVTPEGKVAVVYRLNLDDPKSFLVSQSFPVNNKDVLYISNASIAELQKFLNLLGALLGPFATYKVLTD